jgi:hypothetical protein
MKQSLLILFCFLFLGFWCQSSLAQDNYVEGKVIFLSGDSLTGYINYKNWRRNPEKIFFKENFEQQANAFVPNDIQGFTVKNEKYFSANVQIETSQSHLAKLTEDSLFHFEDRTVFLQVLVEGIKSLYYLNDENDKEHFYIRRNGNIELLQYKRYIRFVKEKDPIEDFWIKNTLVMETQKHIFQLINYMEYCADLDRQLKKLTYTRKSMEALYRFYFSCRGYNSQYEADVERVITKKGVVAGFSSTEFSFTSSFFTSLAAVDFPRSNNISAGASIEFILPRSRRHWSFYNELMLTTYSIEGGYQDIKSEDNYSDVTATFGQSFLKINNMLRYTQPIGPVALYLQAGLSNGFLVQETNIKKTETYFFSSFSEKEEKLISETQPHETEILAGAGLRFKNISVGIRYEQGNGPSNNLALKGNVERYYLLVGYRF